MVLANGEILDRSLQEMITEHKVWRKQSKNKCSGYNQSIEKIVQNTFKETITEGISNGCNHQTGVNNNNNNNNNNTNNCYYYYRGGGGGGEGGGGEGEGGRRRRKGVTKQEVEKVIKQTRIGIITLS